MNTTRTTRAAFAACVVLLSVSFVVAQDSSGAAKNPASSTGHKPSAKHTKKKKAPRGQQKIDAQRATEIQQALIREHYMTGSPTGAWNEASEEAMRRYQGDNGWQTKEVPDSRALIKLGLGPSNDHLLNPDSAMTSASNSPRPTSQTTAPTSQQDKPATPGASSPVQSTPVQNTPVESTPVQSDPPSPQ
jgi:Spy/CpxP family protein refolding chaperone